MRHGLHRRNPRHAQMVANKAVTNRRSKHEHRLLMKYTNINQSKVWTADGSMLPGLEFGGVETNHRYFQDFLHIIAGRVLPWKVWLCVFHLDAQGKPFIKAEVADDLPPAKADDLADELGRRMNKLLQSCNRNLVISHGWFAMAAKDIDLDAMQEDLVNLFAEWGAFDKDHVAQIYAARKEAEEVYGGRE